jgi:pilus assembly protein CpaE
VPFDRKGLTEALRRLGRRVAPDGGATPGGRGRIVTFLGSKGGCGTTTVAANLAVTMARQGHQTILVDLDLTGGDLAVLLDLVPSFGVPDVVENAHRLDRDLLNGMVMKHASGLEVLCAGEDPERAAGVDASRLAPVLAFLRDHYECVVLNTKDAYDPLAAAAAQHADAVHLVTSLDLLALRRAQWAISRLTREGIAAELFRLVVNRYEKNPYVTLEEAEKVLGMKVAWTIPADPRTVRQALHEGLPAVTASRNGLHSAFEEYAGRLSVKSQPAAAPRRGLLGLFSAPARRRVAEGGAQS